MHKSYFSLTNPEPPKSKLVLSWFTFWITSGPHPGDENQTLPAPDPFMIFHKLNPLINLPNPGCSKNIFKNIPIKFKSSTAGPSSSPGVSPTSFNMRLLSLHASCALSSSKNLHSAQIWSPLKKDIFNLNSSSCCLVPDDDDDDDGGGDDDDDDDDGDDGDVNDGARLVTTARV